MSVCKFSIDGCWAGDDNYFESCKVCCLGNLKCDGLAKDRKGCPLWSGKK